MRYKTIVDKNDDGLEEIIEAVQQFEEDRFLASLSVRRYTPYDIQQTTLMVREYQTKMNREVLALDHFANNFIQEYATDNNQCFEIAQRLFNRIRSTISASRKVFRKTCPIVRKPMADRPSIFKRSVLSYGFCQRDIFGVNSFDEAVKILYEDLKTFFTTIVSTLVLCRRMIHTEMAVREDGDMCLAIYKDCREKALASVKEFTDTFGMTTMLPETELLQRMRKAKSLSTYAKENYHKFDAASFRMSVLVEAVRQGRNNGLTDDEARLWPNDHEKALLVRQIIETLDGFDGAEGQKGKLNGNLMVEFVKWCGVTKGMEKNMYETYFLKTYKGQLKPLSWSTICKVRKEREDMHISDEADRASFENRLKQMMKVA